MKTVRLLGLGAALALGAATVVAQPPATASRPSQGEAGQAQPRHDGPRARAPRGPRGGPGGPLLAGITLTDAQREQIRAIGEKHRAQFQGEARQGRSRSMPGAERTRPDSAQRAAMRAQREQRRAEFQALRQQHEAELRAVLTPEQQQTFDANRARIAERMSEPRRGRMRAGRGDGPRRDGTPRAERPARTDGR